MSIKARFSRHFEPSRLGCSSTDAVPLRAPLAEYVVQPVPRSRRVVLDTLVAAGSRFPVHGLVEFDVGDASARIPVADPPVSWTGFVIATMARAVALNPELNARRAGRRLLLFDRVDVAATVERNLDAGVVLGLVTVKDADKKSCAAISAELHDAKRTPSPPPDRHGVVARMAGLPGPIRRRAIRLAGMSPRVAGSFVPWDVFRRGRLGHPHRAPERDGDRWRGGRAAGRTQRANRASAGPAADPEFRPRGRRRSAGRPLHRHITFPARTTTDKPSLAGLRHRCGDRTC